MRSSSRLQPPKPSASSPSRRSPNLHLPGLPRFHPANYPTGSSGLSTSSSSASGSSSSTNSPPSNHTPHTTVTPSTPQRPQYHSRQYSDAQRQLYAHQRELINLNQYAGMSARSPQPVSPNGYMRTSPYSPRSPRLHPLGSPGPVTPLELEEHGQQQSQREGGYLFAGAGMNSRQLSEEAKDQILESFIQKETAEAAARGSSSSLSPHARHARVYPYAGALGVRRGDHTSHRSALSR